MDHREELARRYGFESFAKLLDVSEPLLKHDGDKWQSYLARHPDGHWFVWDDVPLEPPSESA